MIVYLFAVIILAVVFLLAIRKASLDLYDPKVVKSKFTTRRFCSYCGQEIMPQAVVCPHCGGAVSASLEADIPSTGLNVLAFFIPLAGLILYLVYHDKTPNKAKAISKWALIGFGIGIAFSVISVILSAASLFMLMY